MCLITAERGPVESTGLFILGIYFGYTQDEKYAEGTMQKWEYMRIEVEQGYVLMVNGKYMGTSKMQQSSEGCPSLFDFQKKIGSEGWEVVTYDVNNANQIGTDCYTVTAKRPIP